MFPLRSTVSNINRVQQLSYLIWISPYRGQYHIHPISSIQLQNSQQSIQFTDIFFALFGTFQHIYLHPVKSYSTPFFLSSPEPNIEEVRLEC